MPRLIQTQATGLLSLLTSKDGGVGPPAMEDFLRLTLDTYDFYGLAGRVSVGRGQTAAQLDAAVTGWIGAGGALTTGWIPTVNVTGPPSAPPDVFVPAGELWRVLSVTIQAIRVTGTISVAAGWAHNMFPNFRFMQLTELSASVATAGFSTSAGTDCDFIALPGSAPAFFVPSWDLGVTDFNVNVWVVYERMPI